MHNRYQSFLIFIFPALIVSNLCHADSFVAFESGHVRPLALSSGGDYLYAVNTPDNQIEVFDVTPTGMTPIASIPVGMEPVAIALRDDTEAWVVNHLSDSISIIDLTTTPPRVVRTLLVGDEPRDIVFAGTNHDRAFITTAHRGQNRANDPQLTTPGVERADVWVFEADNLDNTLEGTPLTIVQLFTDTPRALAVTPDGSGVYAAGFHTGNQSTAIHQQLVCTDSNKSDQTVQGSCSFSGGTDALGNPLPNNRAPGGLPLPTAAINGDVQRDTGIIVRFNGSNWVDELGRIWDDMVKFNLPDKDVFLIDAVATPPVETDFYTSVGTILFNMVVNPISDKVYVSNTEAINETRFEGTRATGNLTYDAVSTVNGHHHEVRITVLDGTNPPVTRHLNKHIDYSVVPSPPGVKDNSLAIPMEMVVSADGNTLYLAAFGSSKVGIFNTTALETDSFVPDSANHITVSGGGASGLVLDESRDRLYVFTRFDNSVSIIDTTSNTETGHFSVFNPEPASITDGRSILYDANFSSSNGEASCASCHVFGDFDSLAWDLGDPTGGMINNPGPFTPFPGADDGVASVSDFTDHHPMKGPMTTQTLRGLGNSGQMHWRGDRTGGNDEASAQPDSGSFNEILSFRKFSAAFEGLLGRDIAVGENDPEMADFAQFMLQVTMPPNPVRNLNNLLTNEQTDANNIYFSTTTDGLVCNACHVSDEAANDPTPGSNEFNPHQGFFGTDGESSFEGETQFFKVSQLRNLYQKVGMFGMADTGFFNAGNNQHQGDQIRGFGMLHDGSVDTLLRFFNATPFIFPSGEPDRLDMESLMLAFNSNLKPVVGQQTTLTSSNRAEVDARITLFIDQAANGFTDLVVKGLMGGIPWGAVYNPRTTRFDQDTTAAALAIAEVKNLAQTPGQELTFTSVPPGSGNRVGIDRDEDGVLNFDDNCPSVSNNAQTNSDSDTLGDACEALYGTDAANPDSDADGIDDGDEINLYLTNPTLSDTDGDGFSDGDEVAAGTDPRDPNSQPVVADGDINIDGNVDMADVLLGIQAMLGQITLSVEQTSHADVAPLIGAVPQPNGEFNLGDVLLIQGKALGLISF